MSKHLLTRAHVLKQPEEISALLKLRPTKTSHFSFYSKKIDIETSAQEQSASQSITDFPLNRLGLAIPKKMAKRAIDRNRIKRVIREAFRQTTKEDAFELVVKLKAPIGVGSKRKLREKERQIIRGEVLGYFND